VQEKEKVYISRDEDSDFIFVWRKPTKGNWSPSPMKDSDIVNYNREDINNVEYYLHTEFKKKFGMTIRQKTKKCVHLPLNLLNKQDFQTPRY
jgi:AraC-like DNA-binding protein